MSFCLPFGVGNSFLKPGEALLVQSVFCVINVSEKPVTFWELEKCEATLMTQFDSSIFVV
jgi:hypothetical protein